MVTAMFKAVAVYLSAALLRVWLLLDASGRNCPATPSAGSNEIR